MDREANLSGILSQTADVVGASSRAVLLYVLVLGLFSGIGGLFGLVSLDENFIFARWNAGGFETEVTGLFGALFGFATLILFVVASYLLLTQMMGAIGRPMRAGPRFWSFVGMSILALLGTMVGFVFLIIPGIILLVRWSAANGYVLSGDRSITGSLGASWEATDGHGLSIFGAGLLLWIALAILSSVISGVVLGTGLAVGGSVFSPMMAAGVTLSSIVDAISNAVSFAFSIAVFHLVSPADESMAEVFD